MYVLGSADNYLLTGLGFRTGTEKRMAILSVKCNKALYLSLR